MGKSTADQSKPDGGKSTVGEEPGREDAAISAQEQASRGVTEALGPEAAAQRAGHEAFAKARAEGADVGTANDAAAAAYRDAGGTNPALLQTTPLPEAVVGPEEQLALKGAIKTPPPRGIPEMPPDWLPDEIRFEMRTEPVGGGKVALGAIVQKTDDPSDIFEKLRAAIWQGKHGIDVVAHSREAAEISARPSSHCLTCGAPAWAGVPNRVGKPATA